jgi:hypothetical protein
MSSDDPVFDPSTLDDVPWLADLVASPPDSFSWPRYMTPVHPNATGSYGAEAEAWIEAEHGMQLRHWQRFAMRRQLEHDDDGALVWQSIIESTPRRAGKSIRLRCVALYRVGHAERYGEQQLVLHCGKDAFIAREIHRRAWHWAKEYGWHVKQQNGNEEIETPDGSRWLVRGTPSVYGYDVGLGIVDEAWGVDPLVVDDGLEPALMERTNPQLWLLSTAHRRATSLMRKRIDTALAGIAAGVVTDEEQGDTLLMLWCAGRDDDISAEETWRRASPYWTEQRRKMIGSKYRRAQAGEGDAEVDDPDPIEGFRAQYLNVWPPASRKRAAPGRPLVTDVEWQAITGAARPRAAAASAAIESWFSEGVCAALAWQVDGRVVIEVTAHDDIAGAVAWAELGTPAVMQVGKSLLTSPVFRTRIVEAVGMTSRNAVEELRRLLDEGVLRVADAAPLGVQVEQLRTLPGTDGPRLVSRTRTDAIKVAVWAAHRTMTAPESSAVF